MKILGVILARAESKEIPGKNIKEINGKPLISYTIEEGLKSNIFTNFVVSTDSEKIAAIARDCGAEVPFIRPAELAEDHVWSRDALKHAVLECEKIYGVTYDYVFELPCVAPLRNEEHIREAYQKIISEECDSVTSFTRIHEVHPTRMKRIIGDEITDFCKEYPGGEGSRRQDLEPCYMRNGAIFAMTRKCIVEEFSRHGKDCRPYIMDEAESINIDTILDFKLADLLIKERSTKLKIKLECPTNFISKSEVQKLMSLMECEETDVGVECLIVNPGTNKFLGPEYFNQFPFLKVVGTPSTGINHLDVEYLGQNGVSVKCLLDDRESLDNIHASAEFTWLHIMNAVRKFGLAVNNKKNWREKNNEAFLRSNEMHGKKLGIVGMGRIGKKLANYAKAFGMQVFWHDPYVNDDKIRNKVNNLNDLKDCDILSINCYLTDETKELITYETLDDFKTGLIVVNTSRGEVVNEDYIYDLVVNDEIRYSADVLCNEQNIHLLRESKLFNLDYEGVTITPHVAGATVESQFKALEAIIKLCKKCIK